MARLSLGWLKPPKVPADGVMSLGDHLREFRYRVVLAAGVVVLAMIVCAIFYRQLEAFALEPYYQAVQIAKTQHPDLNMTGVLHNSLSPIVFTLRIVAMSGLIVTSPVWLYQVWAYIRPALLKHEKRYAMAFVGTAAPLFVAGCALAYFALPQGVSIMLSFTPIGVANLLDIDNFLQLLIQIMLIFGLGFLLPLVVVALNLLGIVSGNALKRARKGVIFGCFLFAAALTPGGDPFSMLALSIPMMILFLVAEGVCHLNDKRRAKRLAAAEAADSTPLPTGASVPALEQ